jgi:hypothetical protein
MFILKKLCAFAALRETLFIEVSETGCLKMTVLGGTPQPLSAVRFPITTLPPTTDNRQRTNLLLLPFKVQNFPSLSLQLRHSAC